MPDKNAELAAALESFVRSMDDCVRECEAAETEIQNSDERFWRSLWKYPRAWSWFFGVSGAVVPIGLLMLWHWSRGGAFVF